MSSTRLQYAEPAPGSLPRKYLAVNAGGPGERRFVFYDTLDIGRLDAGQPAGPGRLLVEERTISSRHCLLTQHPNGRCTIRDMSRNGTKVDGRRLVPNVETEVRTGQTIEVGAGVALVLGGEQAPVSAGDEPVAGGTVVAPHFTIATVLVGDIRDYTVMVRQAPAAALQQSVGRVFEELTREVVRQGGTVKEYQGDAIFAFWEGPPDGQQAVSACRAALALHAFSGQLASDAAVWSVPDFPLGMDWALATGPVIIDSIGGVHQRAGLSMIGEAVVRAFRIEKFASAETGPIVTCEATWRMAQAHFRFSSLGERQAKGFDRPDRVYALLG